ncbi:hypothetical protein ScPMuIL_009294, partial [Solemya velum]
MHVYEAKSERCQGDVKLKEEAENAYEKHVYDPKNLINYEFLNSKKLVNDEDLDAMAPNTTATSVAHAFRYLPLRKNLQFNNLLVNTSYSTVHVPTNVYDKSTPILNGIQWSDKLTNIFRMNAEKDPSMTWQYFCSSDGFFRVFPGMKWPRDNKDKKIDLFDCRMRNWYIKAATSPKNILILVDTSGSMKGLRMEIARSTISTILDTLSDDDYFKIMNFSESTGIADDCFKETMIRANTENKQRLKEAIQFLPNQKIANFQEAFKNAFQLFRDEAHHNRTLCNKAIMLITDGAPENYEWIFDKYNWPNKSIRVFTYLIGREVSDNKQVKWMACANKGYYTHISTLADVQENVQKYVKVLSRPMVLTNFSNHIWTPVYLDHITESSDDKEKGLKFMTSVAVPVFDRSNETKKEGNLLGVIGTDVPVEEIKKFTPPYKLGPNSYAFAVTNNGYILFHPDFRPIYRNEEGASLEQDMKFEYAHSFDEPEEEEEINPGFYIPNEYNSVELSQPVLEQPPHLDEEEEKKPILKSEYNSVELNEVVLAMKPQQLDEMQKNLLSHYTGSKRIQVKVHYDNMRRVSVRQYSFYYSRIHNSSFSLGIALPSRYENTTTISADRTMSENYFYGNIELAPWQYCIDDSPFYLGRDRIKSIIDLGSDLRDQNCNNELLQQLIWEAQCTCKFVQAILPKSSKRNQADLPRTRNKKLGDDNCKMKTDYQVQQMEANLIKTLEREDVDMVFVGTGGGLTRYVAVKNLTEPNFIKDNLETVRSQYYERAVEGRVEEGYLFTYSVPLGENLDPNNTVVTGSAAIILPTTVKEMPVCAVVGFQMKYRKFKKMFFNVTNKCQKRSFGDNCQFNCSSSEVNCYLLDNHGYIMLSNIPEQPLGQFFGLLEGDIMQEFIRTDIFIPVEMVDHQAVCPIRAHGSKRSSAGALFNPMKHLCNLFIWAASEVILFFSEWNFFNIMKNGYSAFGIEYEHMSPEELEVLNAWQVWNSRQMPEEEKIIGYRPCKKNFTLYLANFKKISKKNQRKGSFDGTITKCNKRCASLN